MMLPCDIDFLVRKERQKDLLREIACERLIQAVEHHQVGNRKTHRAFVAWVGRQMVRWGSRLQNYSQVSPTKGMLEVKHP
jgi:hypothetical protein